jgi:predicted DNA-binding protein
MKGGEAMNNKCILAVSMSKEEKEEIREAAKREGRTAAGYVRYVVLSEIRKQNEK